MDYGRAVRVARALVGLQQNQLAKLADLDPSHLSLIEAGKRNPSLASIRRIARALEIPEHVLALLAAEQKELENIKEAELARIGSTLATLLTSHGDTGKRPKRKRKSDAA